MVQVFDSTGSSLRLGQSLFPRLVEPLRPRGCVSRPAKMRQQTEQRIYESSKQKMRSSKSISTTAF
jgi:hypothetical protein